MTDTQKRNLTGAAIIIMVSVILSRLTGFVRTALINNTIQSLLDKDAYFMSFKITDLMYNLLVGGAISAALIPVLSGYIARNEEKEGWKSISTFINVTLSIMIFLSILGMIFPSEVVGLIARDYTPQAKELTASLVRILFPSVAFIMMAGLINGVLNSYQKFAAAAYGPIVYNLGSIASILFLYRFGIKAVAYGVMASAGIYFLFQLSFAWKNFKFYQFKFYMRHKATGRLFKLAVPSLLASSVVQVNLLISATFASVFAYGSYTALTNANETWQLPYGIFGTGIGIAILPMLSNKFAVNDINDFKNIMSKSLKNVLMVNVPAMVAFIILSVPVISTIYKWSNGVNVNLAAGVLVFYSIALISQSILVVISKAFYAFNDTKTPLYTGIGTIIINAVFCVIFNNFTSLGVAGVALAFSIASLFNAFSLLFILAFRKKLFDLPDLKSFVIKVSVASALMGLVLFIVNGLVPVDFAQKFSMASKLNELMWIAIEVVIGLIVYFGAALLLKMEEAQNVLSLIGRKLKIIK